MPFAPTSLKYSSNTWWAENTFCKRILFDMILDIAFSIDILQKTPNDQETSPQSILATLRKDDFIQPRVFLIFCHYFTPEINEYLHKEETSPSIRNFINDNFNLIHAAVCTDWKLAYYCMLTEIEYAGFEDLHAKSSEDKIFALIDKVLKKFNDNVLSRYLLPIEVWLTGGSQREFLALSNHSQRTSNVPNEYASFVYSNIEEAISALVKLCLIIYKERLSIYGSYAKKFTSEDSQTLQLYLDYARASSTGLELETIKQAIPTLIDAFNEFHNHNNKKLAQMMKTAGQFPLVLQELQDLEADLITEVTASTRSKTTKRFKI